MSHGRIISKQGKYKLEFDLAISRSHGRCQVRWGAELRPCGAAATEVYEEPGPDYVAMCTACRRRSVGPSAAEKRAETLQAEGAQLGLGVK